jgi:phosphoglycolate phosphatase-like HAD superfamily hydrolase
LAIDFDDTLFTLPVSWQRIMAEFFVEEIYGTDPGYGTDEPVIDAIYQRIAAAAGTPLSAFMRELRGEVVSAGRRPRSVEEYRRRFDMRWREWSDALHAPATVTPGMLDLLAAAKRRGIPVAVVSGGDWSHKVEVIRRTHLDDVISSEAVLGDGDPRILAPFTKQAALEWVRRHLARDSGEMADDGHPVLAFIGDGVFDMLAARAVGALAVGLDQPRHADVHIIGAVIPAEPLASLLFDDQSPLRRCPLSHRIASAIDAGVREQRIHWTKELVHDRRLDLTPLSAIVRYVPTFAERQLYYDGPADRGPPHAPCRLCTLVQEDAAPRIRVGTPDWVERREWSRFDRRFVLVPNHFPYLDLQVLAATRRHAVMITAAELTTLATVFLQSGLRSVLMQVEGSGATVPEHAHMSLSAEPLPLFGLPRRGWLQAPGVRLDRLDGYPGAAYVVAARDVALLCAVCHRLLEGVRGHARSFNLFLDESGNAYIVLRDGEYSTLLHRNIGSVEVAGMYLGNARDCHADSLDVLRQVIRQRCDALTAERFSSALREVVTPWQDGDAFVTRIWSDMVAGAGVVER